MSIPLGEFWKGLVRSGIVDASGCKQIAGDYADANQGTPPSDSSDLANFLRIKGTLTDFQTESLLADPPREIRSGNFVVRAQKGPKPLPRWIPVSRLDDGRVGVLFRVAADQFIGGRDQWLQAHEEVETDSLQTFDHENQQAWTLIFSELPRGQALSRYMNKGACFSQREVCEFGIALANGLAAMHQRPLVHGAIRAEHVWLGSDGNVLLLRDPSGPPQGIDENHSGWFDGDEAVGLYAAPEFSQSDQECNAATDIYALGCLLFRLATGRFPADGASNAQLIKAHASVTQPELAEAVKKGEAGDPLYRVLAFAMAKNPASRFAAAEQLSNALTAIISLVSSKVPTNEVPTNEVPTNKLPANKLPTNKGASITDTLGGEGETEQKLQAANRSSVEVKQATATSEAPGSKDISVPETGQEGRVKTEGSKAAVNVDVTAVEADKKTHRSSGNASGPTVPAIGGSGPSPSSISQSTHASEEAVNSRKPVVEVHASSEPAGPTPVAGEASAPKQRSRRKKKSKAPLVLGAMCVAILLLMIGLLVPRSSEETTADKERTRPPVPAVIPRVSNRETEDEDKGAKLRETQEGTSKSDRQTTGYQLVDDDRLLYVPPYSVDSEKASLEYLPPGPAMIASLRISSIVESNVGGKVIEVLSPDLDALISRIAERAHVPVDSIQTCGLAFHPGKEGWPEVSLSIQLKDPVSAKDLLEKWEVAAARTADGVTIYAGDSPSSDAYYFEGKGDDPVSRFAIGSVAKISEVAEMEGASILLPRNSLAMWNTTSAESDIVVLFASPNFLFADGRQLLSNSLPGFVAPLKSTLQPDVSAMLVTVDFGSEQMFIETRLTPSGGASPAALVRMLQEKIGGWPDWADDFIINSVPDASWRLLANRLRPMVNFVAEQVRFGVSDEMAITNAYLPAQAVPQVVLATVLALNTPEGGSVATGGAVPKKPLSIEELLNRKMSVTFEQESLEFAINNIVTAYERDLPSGSKLPNIRIIGGDLQLMGITQNQQVRNFTQTNTPLRQVLTELLRLANPDKTATGPDDEKQALIWVVTDDAKKPGTKEIIVTTRNSAQGKYEVPPEFKLK